MQKLSTDEIGKSYKRRQVVSGVSIHVSQGEVVGLLGPNGAGKTTSFYMIVGLIAPDSGQILADGEDFDRAMLLPRTALVARRGDVGGRAPSGDRFDGIG